MSVESFIERHQRHVEAKRAQAAMPRELVQVWEVDRGGEVAYYVAVQMRVGPDGALDFGNLSSDGNCWRMVHHARHLTHAREVARTEGVAVNVIAKWPRLVTLQLLTDAIDPEKEAAAFRAVKALHDQLPAIEQAELPDGIFMPGTEERC